MANAGSVLLIGLPGWDLSRRKQEFWAGRWWRRIKWIYCPIAKQRVVSWQYISTGTRSSKNKLIQESLLKLISYYSLPIQKERGHFCMAVETLCFFNHIPTLKRCSNVDPGLSSPFIGCDSRLVLCLPFIFLGLWNRGCRLALHFPSLSALQPKWGASASRRNTRLGNLESSHVIGQ